MKTIGTLRISKAGDPKLSGEVTRVTKEELGPGFGPDRKRRLVVRLENGDVLKLRPLGCRKGEVTLSLRSVYRWALIQEANRKNLERARSKKARKSILRVRRQVKRMEKRLFPKKENV
jgi:hypothetical protein